MSDISDAHILTKLSVRYDKSYFLALRYRLSARRKNTHRITLCKLPHIIRYILTVRETHRRHVKQTADILLALQNRAVNKLRSAQTQAPASPKVSFRQAIHGLWQL